MPLHPMPLHPMPLLVPQLPAQAPQLPALLQTLLGLPLQLHLLCGNNFKQVAPVLRNCRDYRPTRKHKRTK
jgi:hypothetical protein